MWQLTERETLRACRIIILVLALSALSMTLDRATTFGQETDPGHFRSLKQKAVNPQSGLPKTLAPNRFKGNAKTAYMVAKEIPEILVQMPCFCECESYGHENLLDCFVDEHGAD
jgi:hypothetical protein